MMITARVFWNNFIAFFLNDVEKFEQSLNSI